MKGHIEKYAWVHGSKGYTGYIKHAMHTVPELSMRTRTPFILSVWILLCPHSAPSCITSLRTTAQFNLDLLK